jgi:malate synthase
MNADLDTASKILISGTMDERFDEILSDEALEFLRQLHFCFEADRRDAVAQRVQRRHQIKKGGRFDYLPQTRLIRDDPNWRVAGAGPGLEDRRVEITGPTDRKMTVNALNSGARVWLADQEDATSPTWANVIGGQLSLFDAIRGQIDFVAPDGRVYDVGEETPTIVMRPRGWHLVEAHLRLLDDSGASVPMSGSLVDFGLYFFHNAKELIERGRGPYFYLAKTESHLVCGELHRDSPRLHPSNGPHRDDPGGVRDGGDPVRTSRPLRGAQRRTLGLHLLDHQGLP